MHRVVHAFLAGGREPADFPTDAELAELCAHLDAAARTAAMAERQMRKSLWLVDAGASGADDAGATVRRPGHRRRAQGRCS